MAPRDANAERDRVPTPSGGSRQQPDRGRAQLGLLELTASGAPKRSDGGLAIRGV